MFDLTVLPYFVFAFMAIPPFIFGYFKGWRSGLFTLLLTLVAGGILIGICAGIYESALWPLFKGLFIQSHNHAGLDVESLKEISKTSVVSISVGIALIPMMLIMWGIYMGFKKLLNKYMNPRIKKVSKNEVNVSRKNLKLTRAGGVVINGAAGLIVASAAAGAVSTLVTPSAKSNAFNSMTNIFADGMTFGQGQYNENYQRMFEFVKSRKTGDEAIEKFNELFDMHQATNGKFGDVPALLALFNAVAGSDEFIKETNLMAKDSKEISKALVMMLLGASKTQRDFHLVGFDPAHADGKDSDSGVYDDVEKNIAESFKALESFVSTQKTGFTWNLEGVKEAIEEIFAKKYIDFKKSPYYQEWLDGKNSLERAQKELERRQTDLSTTTSTIASQRATQQSNRDEFARKLELTEAAWVKMTTLMAKIGQGSSVSIPSTPDFASAPWSATWSYVEDDEKVVDQGKLIQEDHTFTPIVASTTDGSFIAQQKAFADQTAKQNDYKNKQDETDDANRILVQAQSILRTLNGKLDSFQRQLDASNKDKTRALNVINGFQPEDTRLRNELQKETDKYNALLKTQSAINLVIKNLTDAQTLAHQAESNAQGDVDTASQAVLDEQALTSGYETDYNSKKTIYDNAVIAAKQPKIDFDNATKALAAAKAKSQTEERLYQTALAAHNKAQDAYDKAKAVPTHKGPLPAVPAIPTHTAADDALNKVTAAQLTLTQAETDNTNAINAVTIAKTPMDDAKKALDDNAKKITRLQGIESAKSATLAIKETNSKQADADLKDEEAVLQTNRDDTQRSDNQKTHWSTLIQDNIDKRDQAIKDRDQDILDIAKHKGEVADMNKQITAQEVVVKDDQTDYDSKYKVSEAARVAKETAEAKYQRLNKEFTDQESELSGLVSSINIYNTDATSLVQEINDINSKIVPNIHHQRLLNDELNPADLTSPEHLKSIAYAEWAIKDNNARLKLAKDLMDSQEGLNNDRAKELKELVTKLFS